ncbi:MAG: hypothetical protein LKJ88_05115 [Bacilli bacterium]|jgi:hypothetical protein|nr:hypothetical protein [Bacilli bacterium]
MDYFDFRRDATIIEHADFQLEKEMLFLRPEKAADLLKKLTGCVLSNCQIKPCIIMSNCRTACNENARFPIYSFYELEMAVDDGAFTVSGKRYRLKEENSDVFYNLEKKTLAKIVLKSTNDSRLSSILPFIWRHDFQEFIFNPFAFSMYTANVYDDIPHKNCFINNISMFLVTNNYWLWPLSLIMLFRQRARKD